MINNDYVTVLYGNVLIIKIMHNLSSTTSGGKTKFKMVLLGDCGVGKSSII